MSNSVVSISSALLNKTSVLEGMEEEWRLMIHDHKEAIKANGTKVLLDPDVIQEYLYRPDDYLSEHKNMNRSLTWIFLYINNLPSKMEFNTSLEEIYVPKESHITDLRSTYRAILTSRKKYN